MIRTLTIAMVASSVLVAGCFTTTPGPKPPKAKDVFARQAEFNTLSEELSSVGASRADYLKAVSGKSAELQKLATPLLTNPTSQPEEVAALDLLVALSASAYLSDLPFPSPDALTSIRNGEAAGQTLIGMCASSVLSDCDLSETILSANPSRQAVSHTLKLSTEDTIEAPVAIAAYRAYVDSLPEAVPDFSDEDSVADTYHVKIFRQNSCALMDAQDLMEADIVGDINIVENAYRSAMWSTFPHTGYDLCPEGGDTCDAAIDCEADSTSFDCQSKTASRLRSMCVGGTEGQLAATLGELSSKTD